MTAGAVLGVVSASRWRRGIAIGWLAGVLFAGCRLRFEEAGGDADVATGDATSDAPVDASPLTLTFGERSGGPPTSSDTSLVENEPTIPWGGYDNISISGGPGFYNHALLRFELANVPGDVAVARARLELELYDLADQRAGALAVHAVGESWDEATATWLSRGPAAWSTAGGSPGPVVTTFIPPDAGPFAIDLPIALVQGWLDDPASNDGIAFLAEAPSATTHYHFYAREEPVLSRRPQLVLELQ